MAFYANGKFTTGIDDANIYFVYMKNFANGYGFTYNIQGERVEGLTSLSWTLIGAGIYKITGTIGIPLLILNFLMLVYTCYKLLKFIYDNYTKNYIAIILSLVVWLLIPGYFDWTLISLLETGLWSSLITLTVLNLLEYQKYVIKNDLEFSFYLILLIICRPESLLLVWFFIALKFIITFYSAEKSFKASLISIYIPTLACITTLLLFLLWRYEYFGYLFPNTYYAKKGSSLIWQITQGTRYILKFFIYNFFVCIIIGWSIIKLFKKKKLEWDIIIFLSTIAVYIFIIIINGGDHFKLFRFCQPFMAIFLLLSVKLLSSSPKRIYTNYIAYIFVIFITGQDNIIKELIKGMGQIQYEFGIAEFEKNRSKELVSFFKQNKEYPSQGVIPAGGSAWGYNDFGKTIDLLALNNVEMAHSKKDSKAYETKNHASFNIDIFYKQQPDLLTLCMGFYKKDDKAIPSFSEWEDNITKNILHQKKFKSIYSLYEIIKKDDGERVLKVLMKNSFAENIDTSNYKVTKISL